MQKSILALAFVAATGSAHAGEFDAAATAYINDHVMAWATSPSVIAAVKAQDAANTGLSEDQILAMDAAWRAEVSASAKPTIDPVMNNPISSFLREQVAASGGEIAEAFVMDNRGLNVATAELTSDYWQGDEDKFTMTYPKGAGAMLIGDVEFDESSQLYTVQVSFTLVDPSDNAPVGAMTVSLNAEQIQ
ncbi:hypothetical protein [Phaeovulum sp. W22_SRMD_FR3]|uniref:hypothetical protein n=1 Tax=Phaeovulum sp. W22_SRMD_FR3 TaxID=3240274 RepID=UPI003F9899DA